MSDVDYFMMFLPTSASYLPSRVPASSVDIGDDKLQRRKEGKSFCYIDLHPKVFEECQNRRRLAGIKPFSSLSSRKVAEYVVNWVS